MLVVAYRAFYLIRTARHVHYEGRRSLSRYKQVLNFKALRNKWSFNREGTSGFLALTKGPPAFFISRLTI